MTIIKDLPLKFSHTALVEGLRHNLCMDLEKKKCLPFEQSLICMYECLASIILKIIL
jgi:hypothetical protein